MKKSGGMQYKILSLILAISLMLGSVVLGTVANDDTLKESEVKSGSAIDDTLTNRLPMILDSSFFHIYWTGLTGAEKTDAKGHIAEGAGVDGTNALRFGKEGIDFSYYETSLKFHKTGCLEQNTKYIVKMMLKVETGSITQVKLGMMDNSNSGITYIETLSAEKLGNLAEGWTAVEFEYTPVNNVVNQWSSVSFNLKTGAEGGTLLLDDLVVYKKDDAEKTNLFTRGSFDGKVRYGEFAETEGAVSHYLPFSVPSETEFPYIYWHGLSDTNAELAKVRLAKNEGVNGTHAVRIGATGFPISYYETSFKFPATGLLEANKKYVISVKIKKDAGLVTSLSVGMLDNGSNASFVYDCNLEGKYITDNWTTFEWEYTPTYNVAGQWSSVAFKLTTGDDGGSVLIDDILVCKADDVARRNIFYKGSFDTTVSMETISENDTDVSEYLPVYVSGSRTHIYWTDLTGDNNTAAKPRTEKGIGFNKTAGMKFGAEGIATSYYETSLKFPNTGALQKDTKYIVEFKAKKGAGNVTDMKVGMLDNGQNASLVYPCELKSELLTENWSRYSFEYVPTYNVDSQWSSVAFNIKTDSTGGYMIIDDVIVYKADDPEKKNIFDYGTFDTGVLKNKVEETATTVSDNLPLDISGSATHIYWTDLVDDNKNAARPRTEKGIGFNKTSGMKIGAYGIPTTYYEASIKFPTLGSLKADTEYVIKFKVKTDKGNIANFKVGVFDNGDDAKAIYPCDLAGVYLEDTWSEFVFKYTPTYKVAEQWSSIAFNIVTGAQGGSLIIDDVTVYESNDPEMKNIFVDGSFDSECKSFAVTETPTTDKVVPIQIFDYTDKASSQSNALPRYYWNDNFRNETRPISVPNGVNGTNALQLGGAYGPINYYGVGFYHTNRGTWDNNTEYEVSVKIKKTQGSITYLKMGYGDPETRTVLSLSDSYITDEWTEFVWRFTTGDNANDPKSDNLINLSFAAPQSGATILIDDLKIYRADDPEKKDFFYKGSFDYIDKGQDPVKWDTGVGENIIPVFSTDYNKDYNVTDEQKAQGDGGVTAKVVNCDTPSGDYCLALGFDKERGTNNEVYITLASTRSGGRYKFGFWVKVVGEVYNAQVGMVEGDYSFESCGDGYSFNQYEHGKWTYHEFIVEDTGTFLTNKSYRRFCVRFNAPAGSGMLIDGVTVKDADHPDPLNYMYFGDFEKSTVIPKIDWKKDERFIYKEEKK